MPLRRAKNRYEVMAPEGLTFTLNVPDPQIRYTLTRAFYDPIVKKVMVESEDDQGKFHVDDGETLALCFVRGSFIWVED